MCICVRDMPQLLSFVAPADPFPGLSGTSSANSSRSQDSEAWAPQEGAGWV